jgi:predicted nucleotidyltransferase
MRLTPEERTTIKSVFNQFFPEAKVYLFGSRVDDNKKGGDIDLLVLAKDKPDLSLDTKIDAELQRKLGEQKIDILYEKEDQLTTFGQLAKLRSVPLWLNERY